MQINGDGRLSSYKDEEESRLFDDDSITLAIAKLAELNIPAQKILLNMVDYQKNFFEEVTVMDLLISLDDMRIYGDNITTLFNSLAKKQIKYFIMLILAGDKNLLEHDLMDYIYLQNYKSRTKRYKFDFEIIEVQLNDEGYEFYPDMSVRGE